MTANSSDHHHRCCTRYHSSLIQVDSEVDHKWMSQCLDLLTDDHSQDEVPVAALIVDSEQNLVAKASNRAIQMHDPTAHAEINVIREACKRTQNYRLSGHTLYVTLEPCAMCFHAILQARIQRIVFGVADTKLGILSNQHYATLHSCGNHHFLWSGGVLEAEAQAVLQNFFKQRRQPANQHLHRHACCN